MPKIITVYQAAKESFGFVPSKNSQQFRYNLGFFFYTAYFFTDTAENYRLEMATHSERERESVLSLTLGRLDTQYPTAGQMFEGRCPHHK